MRYPDRSRLAAGPVLVLLGVWFLAVQFIPSLQIWSQGRLAWPLILVGVGASEYLDAMLNHVLPQTQPEQ